MFTHKYRSLIFLLLLASLLMNACVPVTRRVETIAPQPLENSEPEPQPEQPKGKLPASSPLALLVESLGAAGMQVVEGGPLQASLLDSLSADALQVNGQQVFVYDFGSPEAAQAASTRISPDGYTITGMDGSISSVFYISTPFFWTHERFILQYLGVDEALLADLVATLGQPFADGRLGAPAEQHGYNLLWREVRPANTRVGFAVPCWWQVGEMPAEGGIRSLSLRSYDEAFFAANSVKGNWVDDVWPEGAFKLDLGLIAIADPNLDTASAYATLVDPTMELIQGSRELQLGSHTWVEISLVSVLHPDQPANRVYVFRLAQNELLMVAPYPQPAAPDSAVVQALLSSFAMSSEEAVLIPEVDPGINLTEAACQ